MPALHPQSGACHSGRARLDAGIPHRNILPQSARRPVSNADQSKSEANRQPEPHSFERSRRRATRTTRSQPMFSSVVIQFREGGRSIRRGRLRNRRPRLKVLELTALQESTFRCKCWPICEFVGWDQRSAGPPDRINGGPALSLVPPYIHGNCRFTNWPAVGFVQISLTRQRRNPSGIARSRVVRASRWLPSDWVLQRRKRNLAIRGDVQTVGRNASRRARSPTVSARRSHVDLRTNGHVGPQTPHLFNADRCQRVAGLAGHFSDHRNVHHLASEFLVAGK